MFSDTLLGRGRFLRFDFGWLVEELPVFGGVFAPFGAAPVLRSSSGAQRAHGRLARACGCARVRVRAPVHGFQMWKY